MGRQTDLMSTAVIDLGYRARKPFRAFHARKQRWACIVAHRRAGKTVACVMDLIDAALRSSKPNPRFAYVAPFYAQAKDVAWQYLKQFTGNIPGVQHNESELRVDLPTGGRLRLYGADNYDRMRGIYLDGVILDEYADMDPRAWSEVLRPALSDRKGWAAFIGTPKGKNAFYDVYHEGKSQPDDWYTMQLKASQSGLVDDEELKDARRMMTPEQYEQEYECSFDAAIVGAYYGRDIAQIAARKQIRAVPWEPTLPVYTGWDLGLDDSTAIWFAQHVGQEIRIIDYYETNNTALRDIARELLNVKPYTYAEHYLPHDVEVRELMTAVSRQESLEQLGIRPIVVAPRQHVADGINAVRNILPKCYFDEAATERGLECLKQYQREWDEKKKVFKERPLHDWTSHGADAFRYLATCFEPKTTSKPERRRPNIGRVTV